MKVLILLAVVFCLGGCSWLEIKKDCARVEKNDSVGDNKYVCRNITLWD